MVRTKVFVGNLAFTTKEPELATAFGEVGKVIGANIISRGPRSLGYGFVEMESEEDAKKAVESMNKKELSGRQINVEIARPQQEMNNTQQGEYRARRTRRKTFIRRRLVHQASEEGAGDEAKTGGRYYRRRKNFRRRPKRNFSDREESKTSLFVANLPYVLDDDAFAEVVAETGVKPKTVHVVLKRNGKSKGYGFVELENEVDQKKALEGLNKKVVEGRELSVKIALTEKHVEGEEKNPQKADTPAEKKATPPSEKSTPAEKATAPAEKKSTPPAEKKTTNPEKKDAPSKETKATDKK